MAGFVSNSSRKGVNRIKLQGLPQTAAVLASLGRVNPKVGAGGVAIHPPDSACSIMRRLVSFAILLSAR
jgi:hypothetical protein